MRKSLSDLISKTIVYQYDLPHAVKGIKRTFFSTEDDKCYLTNNSKNLAEIIYNSIIEYSFNEHELTGKNYSNLHTTALQIRVKYNPSASSKTKISYGFHGETLLYCLLSEIFKAKPLISRGYFYSPLEGGESKGYDSYHLIENKGKTELWFGEVKFRSSPSSGLKNAISNLDKTISDAYLEKNLLALPNLKNNFNVSGSSVETIINSWLLKPKINILAEAKKHKMKLVYPVFIIYDSGNKSYDVSIKQAVEYIEKKFTKKTYKLSIPCSLFFVFMPVANVKQVKLDVIQWIQSKKSLLP